MRLFGAAAPQVCWNPPFSWRHNEAAHQIGSTPLTACYGGEADEDAYLTLVPGGQLVGRTDLAKNFDMSTPGSYTVRLDGDVPDVIVGTTVPTMRGRRHRMVKLEAAPVTVQIGAATTPTPSTGAP